MTENKPPSAIATIIEVFALLMALTPILEVFGLTSFQDLGPNPYGKSAFYKHYFNPVYICAISGLIIIIWLNVKKFIKNENSDIKYLYATITLLSLVSLAAVGGIVPRLLDWGGVGGVILAALSYLVWGVAVGIVCILVLVGLFKQYSKPKRTRD